MAAVPSPSQAYFDVPVNREADTHAEYFQDEEVVVDENENIFDHALQDIEQEEAEEADEELQIQLPAERNRRNPRRKLSTAAHMVGGIMRLQSSSLDFVEGSESETHSEDESDEESDDEGEGTDSAVNLDVPPYRHSRKRSSVCIQEEAVEEARRRISVGLFREQRGSEKRKAVFSKHASRWLNQLEAEDLHDRLAALEKLASVFDTDTDQDDDEEESLLEVKRDAIVALCAFLEDETLPRAQSLAFRVLNALIPNIEPTYEQPMSPTARGGRHLGDGSPGPASPRGPRGNHSPMSKPGMTSPRARGQAPLNAPNSARQRTPGFRSQPANLMPETPMSVPGPSSPLGGRRSAYATSRREPEYVPPPPHPKQHVVTALIGEEESELNQMFTQALGFCQPECEWYVRISALRFVEKLARLPKVRRSGQGRDRNRRGSTQDFADEVAEMLEKESDDRVRRAILQALIALLPSGIQGQMLLVVSDHMLVDPSPRIRLDTMKGLTPMLDLDQYRAHASHKEVLRNCITCFDDECLSVRYEAMKALQQAVTKDDITIIHMIIDRMKDTSERKPPKYLDLPARPGLASKDRRVLTHKKNDGEDSSAGGREIAVQALALISTSGNKQVQHAVLGVLVDSNHFVRSAAAMVLGKIASDDPQTVTKIVQIIKQGDYMKNVSAVEALQLIVENKGKARTQLLRDTAPLLTNENQSVRRGATDALLMTSEAGTMDVIRVVKPLLTSNFWGSREQAVEIIGEVAPKNRDDLVKMVIPLLDDGSFPVRNAALVALVEMLDEACKETGILESIANHARTTSSQEGRRYAINVLIALRHLHPDLDSSIAPWLEGADSHRPLSARSGSILDDAAKKRREVRSRRAVLNKMKEKTLEEIIFGNMEEQIFMDQEQDPDFEVSLGLILEEWEKDSDARDPMKIPLSARSRPDTARTITSVAEGDETAAE